MEGVTPYEKVVFGKSVLGEAPAIFVFIAFTVAAFFLDRSYPSLSAHVGLFGWEMRLPLMLLLCLGLCAWVLHRLLDVRYEVGEEYVRSISGILSFSKRDVRVEMADIRAIELDRGIYGRVVNVGNVEIGTAAKKGIEVVLSGVFDPSRVRDLIRERRQRVEDASLRKAGMTKGRFHTDD